MVTCPHRDAERVEGLGDIVRVHAIEREGHHGIAVLQAGRPEDMGAVDLPAVRPSAAT